jgi:hypothetical protein
MLYLVDVQEVVVVADEHVAVGDAVVGVVVRVMAAVEAVVRLRGGRPGQRDEKGRGC